jgi:hypothetical protein
LLFYGANVIAAIQDAIFEQNFFKADHMMQTDYEQQQSRKQINYAPNVVNDYRIRDQQNADRAKLNSVIKFNEASEINQLTGKPTGAGALQRPILDPTDGIGAIAGIIRGVVLKGGGLLLAKTSSRAFFSGAGTEAKAISKGFQTLGQTRAGKNLQNLIDSKNIPWSQAEPMWQRLSATWAKGVPNGSTVNVFLNNPRAEAIWFKTELPILLHKGVNIIYR